MRSIRCRLAGVTAATVLAAGAMVTMAAPAHAFTCPADRVCDFSHSFYGDAAEVDNPATDQCVTTNFRAHSTENNTTHNLVLFLDKNCTLPSGVQVQPLSNMPVDNYFSYRADTL
ncbi:peptidase inhibitor family I36 protein [Streptomyces abikoensis]|uniref:peptidase inhibitor family I36 protein n=1 Tax=Streptomyces abikoensis TaxID=97398 RepID=UPI00368DA2DC